MTVSGGTLRNPDGIALNLNRATVGALHGTDLVCEGQLSLIGTRIASDVDLKGARLTKSGGHPALDAD